MGTNCHFLVDCKYGEGHSGPCVPWSDLDRADYIYAHGGNAPPRSLCEHRYPAVVAPEEGEEE